jgi:2,3-bisphosphoglycerate-dependent phosphoglycerate mutase
LRARRFGFRLPISRLLPMTTLTVIRHGETDWNRLLRFQGQLDVSLNEIGRIQAERVANALAGERFDALICSDLIRTRQTAEPLAQQLGLAVETDTLWREQCFGVLEGLDVPTIKTHYPELWAAWIRHDADYALPGGESVRTFHARIVAAVEELAQRYPGRNLVVVTHGAVLDMLWRMAHRLPLNGPRDCAIPNGGINRLCWSAGALDIVEWADDRHLVGLPSQPSTVPVSRFSSPPRPAGSTPPVPAPARFQLAET